VNLSPTDHAQRTNSPPLQGSGKGWGLSASVLAELKDRARSMRNNPTEPEKRLWRQLSGGQLHGVKFRRQEVIGRFIVDFWCPAVSLAVEVDGDTHAESERDARRDALLNEYGARVVHVSNREVMENMEGVLSTVTVALGRVGHPHPNPSPEGEGLACLLAVSGEGVPQAGRGETIA
jgi:very-short-patch-repair endonuclease